MHFGSLPFALTLCLALALPRADELPYNSEEEPAVEPSIPKPPSAQA